MKWKGKELLCLTTLSIVKFLLRGDASVLFKWKEHRALWNNTKREIELIRGERISVPLYLSQIPHGQAWDRARYYGKMQSPFILVINQLDAQHFCFTISLFHAPTCFEHMYSKHVEAWNKLIVKQKCCASSWLITKINILKCTVSKTSKFAKSMSV